MAEQRSFVALDYVVFSIFLCFSLIVGIYHAYMSYKIEQRHRREKTQSQATMDFLMGGRRMPILPVALSLLTTFLSGVTMLGTPAEIYQRGVLFWVYYIMAALAFAISGLFFIPIFTQLRPISIYEYFEHRFGSRAMRQAAAAIFLVYALFYMGVVLYSPAIALSGVSGSQAWPWILVIGCVCTLYTSIGGLKAVVWTDTLQACFMYIGVTVMIVKGVNDAGGIAHVWRTASDLGRFEVLKNWDLNPMQHNSMWISTFGAFAFWMCQYGLNQMAIQRYCSLPDLRSSRIVIMITVPCFVVLGSIACFIGVIMVAYFNRDCDPLDTREYKADQLVIVFAVRTLRSVPGLPGLFLACLFSSTLSTFSSGMNSQAAVLWEDFLKPVFGHWPEQRCAVLNKFLVLMFGCAATGLAFAAGPMGGIMTASFSLLGAVAGPLVGLFFLGVFVPQSNKYGAGIGLLVAVCVSVTMAMGNFITKPFRFYRLPANDTCYDYENLTAAWQDSRNHTAIYGDPNVFPLFRVSNYLYPLIGVLLVVVLGSILSCLIREGETLSETARDKRLALTFYGQINGISFDDPASFQLEVEEEEDKDVFEMDAIYVGKRVKHR